MKILLNFLERLREALIKHTSISPDTLEGKLILKDKFVAQDTSDIRRKLQKLAVGPEGSLEHLLKVANAIFYNRDQEESQYREKKLKKKKKTEMLVAALRTAMSQDTQGPRFNCHCCGKPRHWKRDCPQRQGCKRRPPGPCPI